MGLPNVDNTSDVNKPVSTAQAAADALKQDKGGAVITSGTTLAVCSRTGLNSTGGAFSVNLPAAPAAGDFVDLFDPLDTWATNNVTVNRNGKNIEGVADNLVLNVSGHVRLEFSGDATMGWRVFVTLSA